MKAYRPSLKCLAFLALGLASGAAWANSGTVAQLSGTLSVVKADGSVRILSQKSEVVSGDTVNPRKTAMRRSNSPTADRSRSNRIAA
jgi:hypothetical protein